LIIEEISKKPFIKSATTETRHFQMRKNTDNGGMQDTLVRKTDMILNDVANPKATLLPDLEEQISLLRGQKQEKERSKINIREELEIELGSKTGFLDELKILLSFSHHGLPR
jgi:hypothetical protein